MNILDKILLMLWIGLTSSLIMTGGYGIIRKNFYFPSRRFSVKRYIGRSAVIWGIMIAFIGIFFYIIQCKIVIEEGALYISIMGSSLGIFFSIISQKLYKQYSR